MKRLVIVGGAGRMGQALALGLGAMADFKIALLIDVREPAALYGATYAKSLSDNDGLGVDVVVDFSAPESVVASAHWCAQHQVGLVVGTTGLSAEQRSAVDEASTKTGVVMASNFALGAVLSERFAAMAAPYFERVEIIELHHDKKVDAPSGTSLAAARAISRRTKEGGLGRTVDPTTRHERRGLARRGRGRRESKCIRCDCPVSSRTRRSSSVDRARDSPSDTTRSTGRASFKASLSRCARSTRSRS